LYLFYIKSYQPKPWKSFITPENEKLCTVDALDLLGKLLVFDHSKRITASEALEHQYFKDIHNKI
jgi:casein kinase II subunit alpha